MAKITAVCAVCNGKHELVAFKGSYICKNCIDHVKTEA